jgi:hypothetical protein
VIQNHNFHSFARLLFNLVIFSLFGLSKFGSMPIVLAQSNSPPFVLIPGTSPFGTFNVPGSNLVLTEGYRLPLPQRLLDESVNKSNHHIFTINKTTGSYTTTFGSAQNIIVNYDDLGPERTLEVGLYRYINPTSHPIQRGDTILSIISKYEKLQIDFLKSWSVQLGKERHQQHELVSYGQIELEQMSPGFYALMACYTDECDSGRPVVNMGFGSSSQDLLVSVEWPEIFYATFQIAGPEAQSSQIQTSPEAESSCVFRAKLIYETPTDKESVFGPGEPFVKTWVIRNDSNCPWGPDQSLHALMFDDGDQMEAAPSISLPCNVPPGQAVAISVLMTAPREARPAPYRGNWRLLTADGKQIGVLGKSGQELPLWVEIRVIDD